MRTDWDHYFLEMAALVASRSRDPSTKAGAVIVGPDNEVRSTGYNGFPRGVNDDDVATCGRDMKLLRTEHAERNAIYGAARCGTPLAGCRIYIECRPNPLPPCADCARAIIQVGLVRVVYRNLALTEVPERWRENCTTADLMLREAGVVVQQV